MSCLWPKRSSLATASPVERVNNSPDVCIDQDLKQTSANWCKQRIGRYSVGTCSLLHSFILLGEAQPALNWQSRTGSSGGARNFFLGGLVPSPSPFPLPLPPFPSPFPLPSLPPLIPFPPLHFHPLRSRPPLLGLGGLGERFSSPSGSGQSPAAKRILVHLS